MLAESRKPQKEVFSVFYCCPATAVTFVLYVNSKKVKGVEAFTHHEEKVMHTWVCFLTSLYKCGRFFFTKIRNKKLICLWLEPHPFKFHVRIIWKRHLSLHVFSTTKKENTMNPFKTFLTFLYNLCSYQLKHKFVGNKALMPLK